jgi:hypothetical protein
MPAEQGLSFLDCICCGFGAVILMFMIVNHASKQTAQRGNEAFIAKIDAREAEVLDGKQKLLNMKAALESVINATRTASREAERLREQIQAATTALPDLEGKQTASRTRLQQMQAELIALDAKVQALRAQAAETPPPAAGNASREIAGDGTRQYLSGLSVHGRRIAIVVDTSASMLGYTILDVIRTRNLDDATQRNAAKWKRALSAIDWLSSQLPSGSQFQLIAFNETAKPVTGSGWLPVSRDKLDDAARSLRAIVPSGGTSLHAAFGAVAALGAPADQIFLLTDGLPTQGATVKPGAVSARKRLEHFNDAVRRLPKGSAVNVILLPMEGDPQAAGAYWQLARATDGSYLAPSKDWP